MIEATESGNTTAVVYASSRFVYYIFDFEPSDYALSSPKLMNSN